MIKLPKTIKSSLIMISSAIACSVILRTLNTYGHLLLPENIRIAHVAWRIVSSLHASLVVLFSYLYLRKHISISAWQTCLNLSTGYFMFDLVRISLSSIISTSALITNTIHHTISLVVISTYIKKYPKLSAQGFLAEMTPPLIYTCWFMRESGHQATILFKVLMICQLVVFFLLRIYNFTKILWSLHLKKATTLELCGFGTMVSMNYFWFFLLIYKAFKTF